jgi:hypothetical protein
VNGDQPCAKFGNRATLLSGRLMAYRARAPLILRSCSTMLSFAGEKHRRRPIILHHAHHLPPRPPHLSL